MQFSVLFLMYTNLLETHLPNHSIRKLLEHAFTQKNHQIILHRTYAVL